MDASDIHRIAQLEDHHWWFQERRAILARWVRALARSGVVPGAALDIGAAAGGNTRVLRRHGWRPIALEYSADGADVARTRGLTVLRGDATNLPLRAGTVDLVTAFDVIEHIEDDYLAVAEIRRVLRPGGTLLVTVPADMRLWSAHDVAAYHFRRYDRDGLTRVLTKAGLQIDELWSWNVLLRPAVALTRRRAAGSQLAPVSPLLNTALRAAVLAERMLPVRSMPGVSLMLRAHRPR
ncbi:class I SAM-dependent methyltransferase [Jidongwangia harbinensis]|uniref:class I SAM-dependent methyltransferase n=1 Tax=Jidongwangia harbinensis TaxID=2878561 RepID=UPI001CDA4657|nr:class I SAM-dependent methyltransferase [Jidongwangia harbinensis]MCA2217896.1 class I SAM-dependent methyltransferase [Jidongwangia harbinensis]